MRNAILIAAVTALAASTAAANDAEPAIRSYHASHLSSLASEPILVAAITAQNAMTASYSQAEIDALDLKWRAEVGTDSALIGGVLEGPAADFLRDRLGESGGTITEIFVMDARGLNVAASDVTSDYWQGDEEKFSETFPRGPGVLHISDVEFDESTQTFQSQVSFAILDPETQQTVGAITVGLNAEALF